MAPSGKKKSQPRYTSGQVLAYVSDGQFGLCQVTKDVTMTATTVTAKILVPSKNSLLRYTADHNGSVKVGDVVANVQYTKEGNFIRLTKKVREELDKLVPAKEETEASETEEESDDEEERRPAAMTQAPPKVASRASTCS